MTELRLAVIIPSTLKEKQFGFLQQAVTSLLMQSTTILVEIYVVSSRNATPELKKKLPRVRFIHSEQGIGFGEMNNFALERISKSKVKFDWLLLLNDDAYLAPDFFTQLLHVLKKSKKIDVIAPIVYSALEPQKIDNFGVEYFKSGYAKNNINPKIETTLASAGCLLIKAESVKQIYKAYSFFFSPVYFYYLEDVDLAIRMRMLGLRFEKSTKLKAFHYGSASSGGIKNDFSLFHTYRNIGWVILCCWPKTQILRNLPNIMLLQLWIFSYLSSRCGLWAYPKLVRQTVAHLPKLLEYRKKTLMGYSSTISFKELLSPFTFRTYHDRRIPAV